MCVDIIKKKTKIIHKLGQEIYNKNCNNNSQTKCIEGFVFNKTFKKKLKELQQHFLKFIETQRGKRISLKK